MAIMKVTKAMAEKAIAELDWKRIDAMTDEDIAARSPAIGMPRPC